MFKTDWLQVIRPLMKDSGAAHPRSRKRFEGFNLPSTAHDWSDDQAFAYKAIRDGLGIDALKAEQYVNTHTDPQKPSGHANLFYPATEPTGVEYDIAKRFFPKIDKIDPDLIMRLPHSLDDNHAPQKRTLDIPDVRKLNPARVQLLSKSGHGMRDGGQNDKATITDADTLPLFDGVAALGKQTNNEQQAIRIAQANGFGGAQSTGQVNQQSQQTHKQSARPHFARNDLAAIWGSFPVKWQSKPLGRSLPGPVTIPNGIDPDNWNDVKKFAGKYEGDIAEPYPDTGWNITYGKGHLSRDVGDFVKREWINQATGKIATDAEKKIAWNKLQAEIAKLKSSGSKYNNKRAQYFIGRTGLVLKPGESDKVFAEDYLNAERLGLKKVTRQLPKEARHLVTDFVFHMGATGFARHKNGALLGAFVGGNSPDYDKAINNLPGRPGDQRYDYRVQILKALKQQQGQNP